LFFPLSTDFPFTHRKQRSAKEIFETLGEVIESRSHETAEHVVRVSEYSYFLARRAGLSEEEARLLKIASTMHDLGKIGIPDAILNKPGKLTHKEYALIKTHTTIGHSILAKSDGPIFKTAAIIALQHHERWDGGGYPKDLRRKNIHIYGRITGLADVFDSLANKRVYKEAWDTGRILDFILRERGISFDPHLVDIFMSHYPEFFKVLSKNADHWEVGEYSEF
jgi:putative two-component system response regulator